MVLALRTDGPEAELALYKDAKLAENCRWQADRRLAQELLPELSKCLKRHNLDIKDFKGIVVFEGPGSYTGLRIGIATANALAYGLNVAVVAASGDDWVEQGFKQLKSALPGHCASPHYGGQPNITKPKK